MRVVSLVPSWTETLLAAGVEVVGRTRFCIHPSDKVKYIPDVGGTKKVDWSKVIALKPDIVIFDKEENTKELALESPIPFVATHVLTVDNMPHELNSLATILACPKLKEMAHQWHSLLEKPLPETSQNQLPGVTQWIQPLKKPFNKFVYLIWQDPWMAVSPQTYIGSIFEKLNWQRWMWPHQDSDETNRYPIITLDQLDPKETLLLFSSEPYPFENRIKELAELGFPSAIVNGESFGWFGVRSFNFLPRQ